jgi:hypothetical protein
MALNACTNLVADAEGISPMRSDAMPHASILSSYIALLCLGKSGFEAINGFLEEFFATALGLDQVPSEGTLRQRMDDLAGEFKPVVEDAAIGFLQRSGAALTPLDNGLMPLDCDVTPFDTRGPTSCSAVSHPLAGSTGSGPFRVARWAGISDTGGRSEVQTRGPRHQGNPV